jgi:protein SCO1/2
MKTSRAIAAMLCLTFGNSVIGQTLTANQLSSLQFDQKTGSQISPDLQFRDENGRSVKLGDYFADKPTILVLGYYQCPMLCTLTFNGMVESLENFRWTIGNQFNVIHVSISPKETWELAAAKKRSYVKRYGRAGAADGWHFLTGEEPAIQKIAEEAGFHFAYDPSVQQYAHPSGLVVLTPEGRISKYFFGVRFPPNEVYEALQDASRRKIGSPIARLVLLCFHYSPVHGKYGALIMGVIRILAGAMVAAMVCLFVVAVRRERKIPSGGSGHIVTPEPQEGSPGEIIAL